LMAAVQHDSLSMKVLDENVAHILNIILKSPSFKKYPYSDKPDLKAHAEVSRKAATEGMILLKNEGHTLPISKNVKSIAAFGNASYFTIAGGTGSGDVNKAYVISVAKGLSNAGYNLDDKLETGYTHFIDDTTKKLWAIAKAEHHWPGAVPEMMADDHAINQKADNSDLALITIGRNAGEGSDRNLETNYNLTPNEQQQIKRIADAFHAKGKKVVIVLNIGGVIDMNGWKDNADAILLAWQPGEEAGNAIADILTGKVNPSGKLASTFPVKYEDVPSAKNFPGLPAGNPDHVVYQEGIYVGYRYYDTYKIKPMYEFGYGLSYTTFSINNLKISSPIFAAQLTATVTVKNTGKVAGKEVVQVYISAPTKTIDKPAQELKAFGKTRLLQPGESQILTFKINAMDLASFHTDASSWITDAGNYELKAGASSRDIRQTANFKVSKTIVVEKDHNVLKPEVAIADEYKGK